MIGWIARLFSAGEPAFGETRVRDASAIAALHATAFRRGWGRDEVERLLLDRQVLGHRVTLGRSLAGFILSRFAVDEAEILSVAVERRRRGRGLARRLLDLHLRRLAGVGVKSVFLEVEEDNPAARRLYDRAGFRQVGKRQGYYHRGAQAPASALILRRDLA
jgi:[ribosomal protein S18]-alanine N-acetyltransferase